MANAQRAVSAFGNAVGGSVVRAPTGGQAGFTAGAFEGYTCEEARAAGLMPQEAAAAGFAAGLKAAGYTIEEARAANYVEGLCAARFTCAEAKAAGFSLQEIRTAGYTPSEVVQAAAAAGRPRWAKLSPNTPDLPEIAGAAAAAGAEAVTVANTLLGMVVDVEARRPLLGAGRGGLSGPAVRPVAVRSVFDTRAAHPELPIIGVGGVTSGVDAVEFLMAGANAVQVGTATFADPRAPARILTQLGRWCDDHAVAAVADLIGAAHD